MKIPSYDFYKKIFEGREKPFAYLDLDLLDQNIRDISRRGGSKKIRLASKSIRVKWVLDYILQKGSQMQGLMCFTGPEAVWLSQQGFDDLLIAYPVWHPEQIRAIAGEVRKGKSLICMLDSVEHVVQLNRIAKAEQVTLAVCLDLDLSMRLPGLHFGVFRSSVWTVEAALQVHGAIKSASNLRLNSLMGYEAQVAGLGDRVPGQGLKNVAIRQLKKRSIKKVARRRAEVVHALMDDGAQLEIVNGGGTGSMESTAAEAVVTEVTAGSGFFASHLFDYYDHFQHLPAAGFAIEVVRQPQPGMYTCHGGGYTASGAVGIEKLPLPYLPKGLKLHPNEGTGEVQTPVLYNGKLELGDPVFMRHCKAGELCERFNKIFLVRNGKIEAEVPTYRGEGKCFL